MEATWLEWERAIAERGITLDRPRHIRHPHFPEIIYPLDYGYVNDTPGEDGQELDVFVGTASTGVVAYERTIDRTKGDTEIQAALQLQPRGGLPGSWLPELRARADVRQARHALADARTLGTRRHTRDR